MENNIKIFDDFLSTDYLYTSNEYLSKPKWSFGSITNDTDIQFNIPTWFMDLKSIPFFSVILKNKIEEITNKKLTLKRVYAGGQTYGQESIYHIDSECENSYTFCLYINSVKDDYVQEGGGNLQFKFHDFKYIIGIESVNNRGVFFPSNFLHKESSYNRFITNLRMSITWNFIEIL
jgi:hypothetical protein